MNADDPALVKITEQIIGGAYKVANTLGIGFLEKVYENVLAHELRSAGQEVVQQQSIDVWYDGIVVGVYIADLIGAGRVIVEVKVVSSLADAHAAQALNYLRATGLLVALVINFGRPRIEVKRLVNSAKPKTLSNETAGPENRPGDS